ncbi:MAG: PAS domain S-box protein [Hormoscilla sp.]
MSRASTVQSNRIPQEDCWMSSILARITEGVRSIDASSYRMLYLNRSAQKIYGRTLSEFDNRSDLWLEVMHPGDRDRVLESISRIAETGTTEVLEYRIIHPKGEIRYLRDKLWAIADRNGTRINSILKDITDENGTMVASERGSTSSSPFNHEATVQKGLITSIQQKISSWLQGQVEIERLFNLSVDLLCIAGMDGCLKRLNHAWESLLGYPTETVRETSLLDLVHPDDKEKSAIAVEQLTRGETNIYFENRYRCADGEYKWIAWTAACWLSGEKSESGLIYLVGRDIQSRKLLEAERQELIASLQESQEKLRATFEQAAVGIVHLSLDGQWLMVNQKFGDLVGYSREEVLALTYHDLTYHDDVSVTDEYLGRLLSGEDKSVTYEKRYLHKDGSLIWINVTASLVYGSSGNPKYYIAVVEEIGDRKQAEAALRESSERFRTVADFTYDWEYWISPGGDFIYISPACERITGYRADEFIEDAELLQKIVHPGDRATVWQHLDEELESEEVCAIDFRIITRSDSIRWIGHICQPVYSDDGRYLGRRVSNRDITDRARAEAEAARLLQNLQEAQRIAHIGNWEFDVATQTLRLSDELLRILGLDPAQPAVPERSRRAPTFSELVELVHPEDRDSWLQTVEKALVEGISYEIDHRILRPDGEIRYISGKGEAILNQQGQVLRLLETAIDITERKQASEALRSQEEFLRGIYDGVEQVIFVVDVKQKISSPSDRDYRFVGWNPSAERLSGLRASELQYKTPEEIFSATEAAQVRQHYDDCLADGMAIAYEECLTLGGKPTWTLTTLTPLRGEAGSIYRIIGTSIDITERKLGEEALSRSEAQLRELAGRETLLNRIANQIRDSLDIDTVLETTVYELRRLLDIDRSYFVWYPMERMEKGAWEVVKEAKTDGLPSIVELYPGDSLNVLTDLLLRGEILRVDEVSSSSEPKIQHFFLALDYTSVLILPIHTQSGKIGALVLAHCRGSRPWQDREVDLMEAVALQLAIAINQAEIYSQSLESARIATAKGEEAELAYQELQQTQVQLIQSEKMSSLGQMIAGIAHEINNPVSFIFGNLFPAEDYISDILGLVELYQQCYPEPVPEVADEIVAIDLEFLAEDLPNLFNSMKMGAERIRDIVKSLRTFSRLDETGIKSVDLHENIDSALMILKSRLKEQPLHPAIGVIKEYGSLPPVACYAGELNQVFMNILTNAIDALDERDRGRPLEQTLADPSTIWISTVLLEPNWVQIRITDNGIGMSPEVQSKIFDPFYTTKPVGSGTGLGLSTSYQIVVEKHHGILRCVSEEGHGTEFVIEIPQQQSD